MHGKNGGAYFIAEVGINHNGDIALAKDLFEVAANAGCNAVKFQRRTVDRVYTREELSKPRQSPFGSTNGDLKRGLEFGHAEVCELFAHARELGVDCTASVWDEESVGAMAEHQPRFLKVPSPLIRHKSLLGECRRSGIPVVLSSGGASSADVQEAVGILGDSAVAVLHCVSAYPCPDDQVNLRQMLSLRGIVRCRVGYSSHELSPYAVLAAAALGAEVIERHITLDRSMWGSDQPMSTEPAELDALVAGVRAIESCLGDGTVRRLPIEEPAIAKLARDHDHPAHEAERGHDARA